MIPKIEIRYSWIYNIKLDKTFRKEDIKNLKRDCSKFEELFNRNINKILKILEKNGKKWTREYIPIYIVKNTSTSFSDPLTIKYNKDSKFMLVVLTHELIHNNIRKKFGSAKKAHEFMEGILNKTIQELGKDFKEALDRFNSVIHKTYR